MNRKPDPDDASVEPGMGSGGDTGGGDAGGGRVAAKAERRAELLAASARIMAARGFHSTRLDDIGASVGVSGPALYRHFPGKQALLGAVLIDISERLRDGGAAVVARHPGDAAGALRALIAFHVDFAFTETDLIRVQDREILNLDEEGRHEVARLQRTYLEHWYDSLAAVRPDLDRGALMARCRAVVGMINASRHVVGRSLAEPTRAALPAMCWAALGA